MSFKVVNGFFEIIVFFFAISVHESAHAWVANRCGDPTARMLGRITLNPFKHLDPIGSLLLPLIGLITGAGIIGWAKPCPVTLENFKKPVRDDVLTTIAGPLSNLSIAIVTVLVLGVIMRANPLGKEIVQNLVDGSLTETSSSLMPLTFLFYKMVAMNILLFVFNLIPIPPLDGSHILRHALPETFRSSFDLIGPMGFILLFLVGGPLVHALFAPVMAIVDLTILRF